jgi:hypothetical protein
VPSKRDNKAISANLVVTFKLNLCASCVFPDEHYDIVKLHYIKIYLHCTIIVGK